MNYRLHPTPYEDLDEVVSFLTKRGLVSHNAGAKEIEATILDLQKPFVHILTNDGYTQDRAYWKLNELFADVAELVTKFDSQIELESRIIDSTEPDLLKITPSTAISHLPAFIALTDFEFDIEPWMNAALEPDHDWERTKPLLRYYELWENVAHSNHRRYIQRVIETDRLISSHPLAVYFDKIYRMGQKDPEIITDALASILNGNDLLPLLSTAQLDWFSPAMRNSLEPFVQDDIVQSDDIISVKSINNYAGSCSSLAYGHYDTILRDEPEWGTYGNATLVYVQGMLTGSIKMFGSPSMLALRTIQNSNGLYPLATGGAYTVSKTVVKAATRAFHESGKFARIDLDTLDVFPIRVARKDETETSFDYLEDTIRARKTLESRQPAAV